MPTVAISKLVYELYPIPQVTFVDVTGGRTTLPADLKTLAVALTEQEWKALRTAVNRPDTWVMITSETDKF